MPNSKWEQTLPPCIKEEFDWARPFLTLAALSLMIIMVCAAYLRGYSQANHDAIERELQYQEEQLEKLEKLNPKAPPTITANARFVCSPSYTSYF